MPRGLAAGDRRVGAVAIAVATVAIAGALVASPPPAARDRSPTVDLELLVGDLERASAGAWRVDWDLVRTTGAGTLRERIVEARLAGRRVVVGAGSVVVDTGIRRVVCVDPGGGLACRTGTRPDRPGASSPDLPALVLDGSYVVERLADRSVAGETARCLSLTWARGAIVAELGSEWIRCHTLDGVPVFQRTVRAAGVDERTAAVVDRTPDVDEIVDLVATVGPVPAELRVVLATA